MPYIDPKIRPLIDKIFSGFVPLKEDFVVGALTYAITKLILMYWKLNPNYTGIAAITGALDNTKMEFYRRVAAPYEDQKILINGDVYNQC